jgi:hypothetical protein
MFEVLVIVTAAEEKRKLTGIAVILFDFKLSVGLPDTNPKIRIAIIKRCS